MLLVAPGRTTDSVASRSCSLVWAAVRDSCASIAWTRSRCQRHPRTATRRRSARHAHRKRIGAVPRLRTPRTVRAPTQEALAMVIDSLHLDRKRGPSCTRVRGSLAMAGNRQDLGSFRHAGPNRFAGPIARHLEWRRNPATETTLVACRIGDVERHDCRPAMDSTMSTASVEKG